MRRTAGIFGLLAAGCVFVVGDDEGQGADSTGASPGPTSSVDGTSAVDSTAAVDGTGNDTLDGICEPDEICHPGFRPVGFTGPFALWRDGGGRLPFECDPAWDNAVGAYYLDFDPGDGTCSCACEAARGLGCDDVTVEHDVRAGCASIDDTLVALPATCVPTGWGPGDSVRVAEVAAQGTCPAAGTLVERTPAGFAERLTLCSAGVVEVCDDGDGICLPQVPPGYETLCLRDQADTGLPCDEAGPYTVEIVANAWLSDSRSCDGVCSCTLDDPVCAVSATAFSTSDCTPGSETAMLGDGACTAIDAAGVRVDAVTPPAGTCSPDAPTTAPTGTVEIGGEVRMCCLP